MSAWTDLLRIEHIRSLCIQILQTTIHRRVGWGMHPLFDDNAAFAFLREQNYLFYLSVTLPDTNSKGPVPGQEMISVFVPAEYERYLENNRYPTCDIQVFLHPASPESALETYSNPALVKHSLTEWTWVEDGAVTDEPCLVRIGGNPRLIQQEDSYFTALHQDGYEFFIQIDERGMRMGWWKSMSLVLGHCTCSPTSMTGNGSIPLQVLAVFVVSMAKQHISYILWVIIQEVNRSIFIYRLSHKSLSIC